MINPFTRYRFKSCYLVARTPQTHWLFLNMYEKWCPNVFGVISLRGPSRVPIFFLAAPEKMLKSAVFELEQRFLHQIGPFFSREIQWEGSLGSWKSILYEKNEKYIQISKFLKFLDFWILDSAWSLTHDCTFLVMESLRHNPCEVTHKISARLGH